MTLAEARAYVSKHPEMLGEVHDGFGLTVEDVVSAGERVDFPEPIQIRNIVQR